MSEMIERVAKAIFETTNADRRWELCSTKGQYWAMARAAIAAMRNPTIEMIKAGESVQEHPDGFIALETYQAMIDHVLK